MSSEFPLRIFEDQSGEFLKVRGEKSEITGFSPDISNKKSFDHIFKSNTKELNKKRQSTESEKPTDMSPNFV